MRKILVGELKRERCNAAALGMYNASVEAAPAQYEKSIEQQITDMNSKEVSDYLHQRSKNIRAYESAIKDKNKSESDKQRYKAQLKEEKRLLSIVDEIHFPGLRRKK